MPIAGRVGVALSGALLLLVSSIALAADGAVELNQTTLDAANPSPIILSNPGSYLLTSNLVVTNPNRTAVFINASRVTLDLGGFAILGPVSCAGMPVVCSTTGTGIGVSAAGSYVTIRNGTIRGMASRGILAASGTGLRVESMRLIANAGRGVEYLGGAGQGSVVTGTIAARNLTDGIFLNEGGQAIENLVADNGSDGISVYRGITLRNLMAANAAAGFNGHGTVRQNLSVGNGDFGLLFAGGAKGGYGNNVIELNAFGAVLGPMAPNDPEQIDVNICNGDDLCP